MKPVRPLSLKPVVRVPVPAVIPALIPALILVLVLTGIGLGMARGAMAADRQLCSVTGPTPIVLAHDGLPLFDADGAPVTLERDICLDCVIAAAALPPAPPVALAPGMHRAEAYLSPRSDWMATGACPGGPARAPPAVA
ncbi:hypothetical protein [Roseicyclus marinus]|uniref:hypothetical protein n=1 Tax=Roseicyclus marinus TaxID=2161673 RepID=UPI00240F31D2|nr:hypothetical protein [Roseicyclus marinus]MDG3041890.1 hypothetical protein [Roseicyclus marinus]